MRALVALPTVLLIFISCGGPRADEGRDALLQVEGARFFREAMPSEAAGPKVLTTTVTSRAHAGTVAQNAAGDLERSATAIAVGLGGDVGYWIVPASIPNPSAPTLPTFEVTFALSNGLPAGAHVLVLAAVDADGHFGPRT